MQFGTLKEIIAQCVNDGQSVALEGFTHLIAVIPTPSAGELSVLRVLRDLRDLHERTRIAHAADARPSKIRSQSVAVANQVQA